MSTPLTTKITSFESPSLLRSEIDKRIVKIRPSTTPLDQISRLAGARPSASMKVEYYSVDIKPALATLQSEYKEDMLNRDENVIIKINEGSVLSPSDTVFFPSVENSKGEKMIFYVSNVDGRNVTLIPVNHELDSEGLYSMPTIPAGTNIVRMGRAAGELDVQTPQFITLPVKDDNLCQIFKAQIEESLLHRLSDKEVGWTFSDQEEVAILDMRMCMERSFLFGCKKTLELEGKQIMLTGGIWHQAKKDFRYSREGLTDKELISMMRRAFSESNGSTRKILLAGSGLIERLNTLDHTRVISGNQRVTKWGIDFDHLVSKFGSLYVARCEVFDLCGMDDYGMVIDPEYITKYSHIPFSAERISFQKQGVRNTEAVVLTIFA